jgi:6-pyruvoyltetrahydropterin/6-carboxytetrahydropterin synthase
MITVTRYHDFCAGHRVAGHENKCAHLHGHNYRVHFTCVVDPEGYKKLGQLDALGRVIDFSVIKERLCMWLERNWDHKFLAWTGDEIVNGIRQVLDLTPSPIPGDAQHPSSTVFNRSLCWTPFNPTAENMAKYLVEEVGPRQLEGTGVSLIAVTLYETRKCSATYTLPNAGLVGCYDPVTNIITPVFPEDH